MSNFKEWFDKKLVVDRYPTPQECEKSDFKYIINVSDEYIDGCHTFANNGNKKYFWFPLNECYGDMGLNSLYGAMQILWIAEEENAKVLLHCHAGANRSPTVADAYFFMRTKHHRKRVKVDDEQKLNEWLGIKEDYRSANNRMLNNIDSGHLPAIHLMEKFLHNCETIFKKDIANRSGGLDWCKVNAKF